MANIEEAKKAVVEFLKKTLNVKDVKVIKAAKRLVMAGKVKLRYTKRAHL